MFSVLSVFLGMQCRSYVKSLLHLSGVRCLVCFSWKLNLFVYVNVYYFECLQTSRIICLTCLSARCLKNCEWMLIKLCDSACWMLISFGCTFHILWACSLEAIRITELHYMCVCVSYSFAGIVVFVKCTYVYVFFITAFAVTSSDLQLIIPVSHTCGYVQYTIMELLFADVLETTY